jgi:hypothetical protein
MAEVDIGSLFIMTVPATDETLSGGSQGTASIELYWGADIAPGQWFQAAIHITPGQRILNPSAAITLQGVVIDNSGATGLWVNVTNFTPIVQGQAPAVEVSINVLSAPGHGF